MFWILKKYSKLVQVRFASEALFPADFVFKCLSVVFQALTDANGPPGISVFCWERSKGNVFRSLEDSQVWKSKALLKTKLSNISGLQGSLSRGLQVNAGIVEEGRVTVEVWDRLLIVSDLFVFLCWRLYFSFWALQGSHAYVSHVNSECRARCKPLISQSVTPI